MDSLENVYLLIGGIIGISVLVLIALKLYIDRATKDEND